MSTRSNDSNRRKSAKPGVRRDFIRRLILANENVTDDEVIATWNATHPDKSDLLLKTVRRERTLFAKLTRFDAQKGLQDYFSSQTALLLEQYRHIEHLLGPPDSDWAWVGEHCEALLRDTIRRYLPPSLKVSKGYVHGIRKGTSGSTRCPEIDILIYNCETFAPLFAMGDFVIVHPESVVAAIQVKRSLDANTLSAAVDNVVTAKQHVRDTSRFNASVNAGNMFAAVVAFEEGIGKLGASALSKSYHSAIAKHIAEFHHGYVLPDFVGSLSKLFLLFCGLNVNEMGYQVFEAQIEGKNVALAVLLFLLMRKVRPSASHLPPAIPPKLPVVAYLPVWKNENEGPVPTEVSSAR